MDYIRVDADGEDPYIMDYIRVDADGQLTLTQSTEFLFLPQRLVGAGLSLIRGYEMSARAEDT